MTPQETGSRVRPDDRGSSRASAVDGGGDCGACTRLATVAGALLGVPVSVVVHGWGVEAARYYGPDGEWAREDLPAAVVEWLARVWETGRTDPLDRRDGPEADDVEPVTVAGVPLYSRDGKRMGVLCVADGQPRAWGDEEIGLLEDLAVCAGGGAWKDGWRHDLVENVIVGMLRTDPDGRILDLNPALVRMMGYPDRDALVGTDVTGLWVEPEERERWRRRMEREGVVRGFETRFRRRDGTVVWIRSNARAVRDADGRVRWFEGTIEDITERKEAEQALREANTTLRTLIHAAPEAIIALDREGRVTLWNPAAERMFGWSAAEVVGQPYPLAAAEARGEHQALLARAMEGEGYTGLEVRRWRRDGTPVDVTVSAAPIRDGSGEIVGSMAVLTDIGERKRTESALRASERRYRDLFDSVPVGLFRSSPDGGITDANAVLVEMLGFPDRETLLGAHPAELYVDPSDQRALLERLRKQDVVEDLEVRMRCYDGSVIWVRKSVQVVRGPDGAVLHYEGAVVDITERREAEEARRKSELRFRALIENTSDVITVADASGRFTYNSPSIERVLGYRPEELLGRSAFELVHPDDLPRARQRFHNVLQTGTRDREPAELRFRHRDGSWRVIEIIGRSLLDNPAVAGVVMNARDITEQKQLEEQLHQSQKMEAVGRLAGGIAHDFNNLMMTVSGYAELVLAGLPADDPLRQDVREIERAADRATELTRKLLAFSRKQMLQPKVLDANRLVEGMEGMLRRLIGEHVVLRTDLSDRLGRVTADPGQLEQVIMNLVVNARDAMPDGGHVWVRTRNERLDAEAARRHPGLGPGDYVVLEVEDTGAGMAPEVRERIFEPFFTTKAEGKGTGLGLSTVYGIVKQSGGHVQVESEVGRGTTFRIYLPRVGSTAGMGPEGEAADRAAATPESDGSETVLVVEDEAPVRTLLTRVLEDQGYQVLVAENGRKALEVARAHDGAIDLLLTDAVMPEMGGQELAERLTAERPDLIVAFISGYSEDALRPEGIAPDAIYCSKPIRPRALLRTLREALDSRR